MTHAISYCNCNALGPYQSFWLILIAGRGRCIKVPLREPRERKHYQSINSECFFNRLKFTLYGIGPHLNIFYTELKNCTCDKNHHNLTRFPAFLIRWCCSGFYIRVFTSLKSVGRNYLHFQNIFSPRSTNQSVNGEIVSVKLIDFFV